MFVGHYAAALAAKAATPRAPIWTLVLGCQLVDVGWSVFIMAGIERASVDPALPGSTLVLEHMPWTHSLPMALVWSAAAALLVKLLLRLPIVASAVVGLTVFSHWLLDWLVHRPDLELWIGGDKVGLGLWNHPVPEQALEMGLLAIGAALWVAARKSLQQKAWPAICLLIGLICVQILPMAMPLPPAGPLGGGFAVQALAVYLILAGAAALTELPPRQTSRGADDVQH